ncbi:hypothetical protein KZ843_09675 [Pseudomonas aeruginosa]|nr:hypothetical protein [Pseudomonas aeruginosa]MBW6123153.1 hypothetical protein [Pseudomonas aeruginosa]
MEISHDQQSDTKQPSSNHWPRGGQAKTSDVNTAMADFLKSQVPKPATTEQPK